MQDLTTGPIPRHLLKTAGFMLVMMVFQTLYFLVDLYWVGRLGTAAVAGVALAGNLSFVVLALNQVLGVGATTAISHAAGRRDQAGARHLFHQALVLSAAAGAGFLALGMALRVSYARAMSADAATAALAADYLRWFVPAMALQFPIGAMSAALRATGQFKPAMLVSTATVVLNMLLAPALMFGWGTGRPMGVAGAAAASLAAVAVGLAWLATYFRAEGAYLRFAGEDWRPSLAPWRRMLGVGLPAGFEFGTMALYQLAVYTAARPFGAPAQAGFGIGLRVMQAGFLPVVALGLAVAPVAGQNVGARLGGRVRETFRSAAALVTAWTLVFTVLAHLAPGAMVATFTRDPAVVGVGAEYLRVISWSFAASGLVYVAGSLFQAMGNTLPPLAASGSRMALVIGAVFALARAPGFRLAWVWYLSAATVWLQLALALWLLRREFRVRLGTEGGAAAVPAGAPAAEAVGA